MQPHREALGGGFFKSIYLQYGNMVQRSLRGALNFNFLRVCFFLPLGSGTSDNLICSLVFGHNRPANDA